MLEEVNELVDTLQNFCNNQYGVVIPLTMKPNGEVMLVREEVEGSYIQVGINFLDNCIYQYTEKERLSSGEIEDTYKQYDAIISEKDCIEDSYFEVMDDWVNTLFGGDYSAFWIASHPLLDIIQKLKEENEYD